MIDDDNAIGEALDLFHVVGGVEQRLAARFQLLEVVEDRIAALRIDADGRFVEEQDVGIVEKTRGEIQPPFHATAEGFHCVARAVGKPDEVQRRGNGIVERRAGQVVQRTKETEVGVCGELVVQREILRHQPNPSLFRIGIAAKRCTVDEHVTAVGLHQPGDHRHGRRLASAVWTEQAHQLTLRYGERHIVDRDEVAERFAEFSNIKHDRA